MPPLQNPEQHCRLSKQDPVLPAGYAHSPPQHSSPPAQLLPGPGQGPPTGTAVGVSVDVAAWVGVRVGVLVGVLVGVFVGV